MVPQNLRQKIGRATAAARAECPCAFFNVKSGASPASRNWHHLYTAFLRISDRIIISRQNFCWLRFGHKRWWLDTLDLRVWMANDPCPQINILIIGALD